jgi:general stress protein 26
MEGTNMPTAAAREENIEKLRDLIKGIKFAMLTTVEENGTLRSRPMTTQEVEFDGDLYFFTRDDSAAAQQAEQDRHVNVSYAAPDKNCYVSVSGTVRILHDRRKMEEYWKPIYKVFFSEGLDDPHLALLKVNVNSAEYWEGPSNVVSKLVGFVKMALGDEKAGGENEKLSFKQ